MAEQGDTNTSMSEDDGERSLTLLPQYYCVDCKEYHNYNVCPRQRPTINNAKHCPTCTCNDVNPPIVNVEYNQYTSDNKASRDAILHGYYDELEGD